MKQALGELVIEGIATTASFHRKIMDNEKFIAGDLTTHFIDEMTS